MKQSIGSQDRVFFKMAILNLVCKAFSRQMSNIDRFAGCNCNCDCNCKWCKCLRDIWLGSVSFTASCNFPLNQLSVGEFKSSVAVFGRSTDQSISQFAVNQPDCRSLSTCQWSFDLVSSQSLTQSNLERTNFCILSKPLNFHSILSSDFEHLQNQTWPDLINFSTINIPWLES